MTAEEFLIYSGEHYDEFKKKWKARCKKSNDHYSDDIFQDSIIKVYNHLLEKPYTGDIESYWYQAFINNTRRDTKYSYHKRDDSIDVLQYLDEFPVEDRPILLEDIKDSLKQLTDIELHIFLMKYMANLTFFQIEELTDVKDVRYKIRGILKKIRGLNK